VAYHALTSSPRVVRELQRGARELPIDLLPGAERCEPGQPLRLLSPGGSLEALAIADPENQLVRVYARADEGFGALDATFCRARVRQALSLRQAFGLRAQETTHRLLHGAGDGLPGFCADVYGQHLVLYVYAKGLLTLGRILATVLREELGLESVVLKLRSQDAAQGTVKQEIVGNEPPEKLVVHEGGVPYEVHLGSGLNVGFFTDMREHRQRLARFARDRSVLNLFSYTASLSVAAARAGARNVTSVDLSAGVQRWARENFRLSELPTEGHRFETSEVSSFLKRAAREGERYDLIIADPPTYSAARASAWSMRKDYPELIGRAAALLPRGGLLWLAANRRDMPPLSELALDALERVQRSASLLERGGLPPDYPTLLAQPQDCYLQVCLLVLS
jgi:23S rRNA (cytosine1962-C5)-methyltransferase